MKEIKVYRNYKWIDGFYGPSIPMREEIAPENLTGIYKEVDGHLFVEIESTYIIGKSTMKGKYFVDENDITFVEEEIFECSTSAGKG